MIFPGRGDKSIPWEGLGDDRDDMKANPFYWINIIYQTFSRKQFFRW